MCGDSINKDKFSSLRMVMCCRNALENSSVKTIYYNYLNSNLYIDMQRMKLPLLKFN